MKSQKKKKHWKISTIRDLTCYISAPCCIWFTGTVSEVQLLMMFADWWYATLLRITHISSTTHFDHKNC
jgi:hypothetical protein